MTVQPEFSRQARRWARLMAGLVAFGVGIALMKHADLGLGPWEVLNDGLSRITGVSLGTVGIVVGVPILLLWLPLRERPGEEADRMAEAQSAGIFTDHLPTQKKKSRTWRRHS